MYFSVVISLDVLSVFPRNKFVMICFTAQAIPYLVIYSMIFENSMYSLVEGSVLFINTDLILLVDMMVLSSLTC